MKIINGGAPPVGAQTDRFREFELLGDPVADALVAAMRTAKRGLVRAQLETALESGLDQVADPAPELVDFIHTLEAVPFWLDYEKLDVASAAAGRVPMSSLLPLATVGLMGSYVSSRVNQVLLRGGDLDDRAAARAVETVQWFVDCTSPGGMERFGAGFKNTARIRVMHAFVRAGVNSLDDWDSDCLGTPINQLHLAITMIPILGNALLTVPLGHYQSPREREAVLHLMRYMAHQMGVDEGLQVTSVSDLVRLTWLSAHFEISPDESSQLLTKAMLKAIPEIYGIDTEGVIGRLIGTAFTRFHSDLLRVAFGARYADLVGLPPLSPAISALPVIVARNSLSELARFVIPGMSDVVERRGHAKRTSTMSSLRGRVSSREFQRDRAVDTVQKRDRELSSSGTG
ncbi:oxygenase MpaB family protein [Gordonia sp. (in: high G+C Gram-positive bacteria)]|uniref:oxygenase MpaB family protein n=1 Tax=Gordonia sp. (in: high G+C Gram-positive bacteria) TaxID=84139 RepID=UPI0033412CA6